MNTADSGSSLIEAVVGMTLLGLLLVGVIDATSTSSRLVAATRQRTMASAMLEESLSAVRRVEYAPCPHIDGSYADVLDTTMVGMDHQRTALISRYEYWSEVNATWVDLTPLDAESCAATPDLTGVDAIQQVTVSILGEHGQLAFGTIVKTHAPHD